VAVHDGDSGPHLTTARQSSLELVRLNRRIVDEVCVAVLRTLPSHSPLISSHSCLSPSEVLAYKARITYDTQFIIYLLILLLNLMYLFCSKFQTMYHLLVLSTYYTVALELIC